MKNETHTHSKRYYIFRHVPGSEEETVMYRDTTGSWYATFDKAALWADHDFVVKKAKKLKEVGNSNGVQHAYCIGQVDIVINGLFVLEVV